MSDAGGIDEFDREFDAAYAFLRPARLDRFAERGQERFVAAGVTLVEAGTGGLAPTGREGTSVETVLFTIVANRITRIDVADNNLDIGIYACHRGWLIPHNIRPQAVVTGIDRSDGAVPRFDGATQVTKTNA
jgi:hypothetical protein